MNQNLDIQEEALASQCTMKEIMYYFGLLFGMNMKSVKQRSEFLKHFLNLPATDQLCGTLRLALTVSTISLVYKY